MRNLRAESEDRAGGEDVVGSGRQEGKRRSSMVRGLPAAPGRSRAALLAAQRSGDAFSEARSMPVCVCVRSWRTDGQDGGDQPVTTELASIVSNHFSSQRWLHVPRCDGGGVWFTFHISML